MVRRSFGINGTHEGRFDTLAVRSNATTLALVAVIAAPYRVVRHAMYLGALLQGFAILIALGSYWAEAFPVAACAAVTLRLLAAERLLFERLRGYAEYARRTRHRLVPGVWCARSDREKSVRLWGASQSRSESRDPPSLLPRPRARGTSRAA
jgi:hypothetical protein